jgi:GntR family transcriptional repressor for pyruvate dehydrogenase complex
MVRRASALPVQVAQSLLQRIIAEEFPAGTVLPSERELQDHYGVSRPVVREAIKLLAARGLISTNSGQGAVVASDMTSPARDALVLAFFRARACAEDILDTRVLLEPEIAALAARQATPLQIRRLNSVARAFDAAEAELDGSEEAREKLLERWPATDARFHVLLAEASQNPVLAILIEVIVGILWQQRRIGRRYPPDAERQRAQAQHRAIADAVAARDPEAARRAMLEHLSTTRTSISQMRGGLQSPIEVMIEGAKV